MEITKTQIKQIQTIMSSRFPDRDDRLNYTSAFLEREIKSTKDLSQIEADEFINFLNTGKKEPANWGYFEIEKFPGERKTLFSLMYQAQWTKAHEIVKEVPDLDRLSNFLKSKKSPVHKPLKQFEKADWSKLIAVFTNIVKGTYK